MNTNSYTDVYIAEKANNKQDYQDGFTQNRNRNFQHSIPNGKFTYSMK